MRKLIGAAVAVVLYGTFSAFAGSVQYDSKYPTSAVLPEMPITDAFGCKVLPQPEVAAAEQPKIPDLSNMDVGASLAPTKEDMDALTTGADLQAMQKKLPTQSLSQGLQGLSPFDLGPMLTHMTETILWQAMEKGTVAPWEPHASVIGDLPIGTPIYRDLNGLGVAVDTPCPGQ